MADILSGGRFVAVMPIEKGWSEDKKYCVTNTDGEKYLLRITPIERYETRKALFTMLEQVTALGIPMCLPVEFGTCTDGVYSLQSWIDGEDLETILPLLSETEQYILGLKSGEIIQKLHSIPAPDTSPNSIGVEEWATRFNRKADIKIQKYHECGLRFEGDKYIINYIEENRKLLENRPQCFQHGDYHVGNMMLENGVKPLEKALKIIDFDRYDYGDPWEEFNRIVFSAAASPHFATGQLRGYFGGEPPLEFFKLLAFYISSNTLSSIYWAIPFGQSDIDIMMNQSKDVLRWYNNMKNPVPTWYLKDFYIQFIDGVPLKLKSPFDFSFLRKYGAVFKVLDDQDSGNICFGISDGEKRYFIKFAGAPAERACVSVEEAVANLKRTVPIYKDLAHPTLIRYIDSEEISGGFTVVFDWLDAECPHPMYPLSRKKFMTLPLEKRVKIFEDVLDFHAHVAANTYVAIDFYDGSILYDFNNDKTAICDIDFYAKAPYINQMGRLWGSSRFMSPEEFSLGAEIDEITNVYAMGATAFALFSDSDHSPEKWLLDMKLYDVVMRAVNDERSQRQQSIRQLIEEWRAAK